MAKGRKRKYQRRHVTVEQPSECRACGSLDREILTTTTLPDGEHVIEGKLYRGVKRQYARCLDCGQRRVIWTPIVARSEAEKAAGAASEKMF